ncbi:MAG TPA: S24 family peptidase, partial [Byssovorax sp.]
SLFAARVVGKSMEPGVPDGTIALFRGFAAGTAPRPTALDGRRVIVELRDDADGELGGRYTLKRWRVAALDAEGHVAEVELRPDNSAYRTLRLRQADGAVRVVGELLETLT